jgi:hypothetical protein
MKLKGRIALATYWTVIGITLAVAAVSMFDTMLRPRTEVRRMLGMLPEGFQIKSTYYVAGLATWDASITERASLDLQGRCQSPAWLITRERGIDLSVGDPPVPKKVVPPARGCVLAREGNDQLGVERSVLLEGRTLQLVVVIS